MCCSSKCVLTTQGAPGRKLKERLLRIGTNGRWVLLLYSICYTSFPDSVPLCTWGLWAHQVHVFTSNFCTEPHYDSLFQFSVFFLFRAIYASYMKWCIITFRKSGAEASSLPGGKIVLHVMWSRSCLTWTQVCNITININACLVFLWL